MDLDTIHLQKRRYQGILWFVNTCSLEIPLSKIRYAMAKSQSSTKCWFHKQLFIVHINYSWPNRSCQPGWDSGLIVPTTPSCAAFCPYGSDDGNAPTRNNSTRHAQWQSLKHESSTFSKVQTIYVTHSMAFVVSPGSATNRRRLYAIVHR